MQHKETHQQESSDTSIPKIIPFTKMEGAGNDYIYVEEFTVPVPKPSALAVVLSDRHFGVGGDGLVLIGASARADFRMRIFNADGSEAEMCGNASRCVGKYVYEHGFTAKKDITLETGAGVRQLHLNAVKGVVRSVRVDMGQPVLVPAAIPVNLGDSSCIEQHLQVAGRTWCGTAVSMGNPHFVVPVPDVAVLDLNAIGPLFENHSLFPKRTNTEFVQIVSRDKILMRVWERGSGETLACGTGACAVLVACVLTGKTDRAATVSLAGGDLYIEWDASGTVFKTGPAREVFSGVYSPR